MIELAELALPPDQSGYALTMSSGVIMTELDGGRPRIRRDVIGESHRVRVQWTLCRDSYDFMLAFYRTAIDRGALPFLATLLIDDRMPAKYECTMQPGSFSMGNHSGHRFVISATLFVVPRADTAEDDNLLLINTVIPMEQPGVEPDQWANILETLVNVDMPAGLGP
jgi:hypothetical protein